jgi:hypothetical protein
LPFQSCCERKNEAFQTNKDCHNLRGQQRLLQKNLMWRRITLVKCWMRKVWWYFGGMFLFGLVGGITFARRLRYTKTSPLSSNHSQFTGSCFLPVKSQHRALVWHVRVASFQGFLLSVNLLSSLSDSCRLIP